MIPIEKRHYHSEVFRRCADYIKEMGIHDLSVDKLVLSLELAAHFVDRSELELLLAMRERNLERGVHAFAELVDRLVLFFTTNYLELAPFFDETLYCVTSIVRKYEFEGVNYRTFEEIYGLDYRRNYPRRSLYEANYSYEFYRIVNSIIRDINNKKDGWSQVGRFLSDEYIERKTEDDIIFVPRIRNNCPVTFLSYAFDDRAYAFFLFIHFMENGGFLFVDFLFNDELNNGGEIKRALDPWIRKSIQFLFLRSIKSDNRFVRQWCSWEIGRSYNQMDGFYTVDVIGVGDTPSKLLDDFRDFNYVQDGIIYGY